MESLNSITPITSVIPTEPDTSDSGDTSDTSNISYTTDDTDDTEAINSIDVLIKTLNTISKKNIANCFKNIEIPLEDFEKYSSWKNDGYTRNCLSRNDNFELILICWPSGISSPIHGHDNQECWAYMIDGALEEKRYSAEDTKKLVKTNHMYLTPGQLTYMDDKMGFHIIENNSSKRAMTLHLYMNPIDKCKVFNESEKQFETKEMTYDTVKNMNKNL